MSVVEPPTERVRPPESSPRVIASETLFPPGEREVLIEHGGERYRLRQTRNDKLILTK